MHHLNIVAPNCVPDTVLRLPVLHVGDGDGFRTKVPVRPGVEMDAAVRFAFIDAPELAQKGGPEARNYLKRLILGKTLDVAITYKTETGDCIDPYGRIVGIPYLSEDSIANFDAAKNAHRKVFGQRKAIVRNVELEMVLNGWAWVLSRYDPDPAYFVAQDEARQQRRGIWAYASNLAPWEFKRQVHRGRQPEARFLAYHQTQKAISLSADCPCESCGGQMQPRIGKRGKFLGCSNFPRCKVTRPQ